MHIKLLKMSSCTVLPRALSVIQVLYNCYTTKYALNTAKHGLFYFEYFKFVIQVLYNFYTTVIPLLYSYYILKFVFILYNHYLYNHCY